MSPLTCHRPGFPPLADLDDPEILRGGEGKAMAVVPRASLLWGRERLFVQTTLCWVSPLHGKRLLRVWVVTWPCILVSFLPGAMKTDKHTVVFLLRPALRASVEASLGVLCSERPGFLQLGHKRVGRCTGHYMRETASPSSGIQRALLRLWVGIHRHWLALRQGPHRTTKGEASWCLEQHLT